MTNPSDPIDCVICPRKADGSYVTHNWAIKSRRSHLTLTAIVTTGSLERTWWALSKSERLLLVTVVERDIDRDLTHLREQVEQDGSVRNFAYRYAMTGGRSQLDDGGFPPALADELAEWASRKRR